MNDTTTSQDVLDFAEGPKVPSSINVLTILTFIGCAIGLIFVAITPMLMSFSKSMLDKAASMQDNLSDKQLADIERSRQIMEVTQQNIVPITIGGIVGLILCFVGALWMRKLKKDGFWLYVAGQLLPLIVGLIFLGKYTFANWTGYLEFIVPVVFISLYAANRKYLVK